MTPPSLPTVNKDDAQAAHGRAGRAAVLAHTAGYPTLLLLVFTVVSGSTAAWLWLFLGAGVTTAATIAHLRLKRHSDPEIRKANIAKAAADPYGTLLVAATDRPAFYVARFFAGFCGFFTLSSVAASIWLDAPPAIPIAYAVSALTALAVFLVTRRRAYAPSPRVRLYYRDDGMRSGFSSPVKMERDPPQAHAGEELSKTDTQSGA